MADLTARQERDIVQNFVHKIGGKANITSKMIRRVEPQFNPYDYRSNFNNQYLTTYEENIVELEIPLSSFKTLAEHSHDIEELRAHFGPNIDQMGIDIMQRDFRHRNEEAIRRTNPGVQKAWERYQTMLKIAGG